jgi:hypothetical protein
MLVHYFAPFNNAETDYKVKDYQYFDKNGLRLGFYLDTAQWQGLIQNIPKGDALAIEAHGNHSLLLRSAEKESWQNKAWIGPHPLWALIHLYVPKHCPIIIQACYSLEFAKFFKAYMGGRAVWGFDDKLYSERWCGPDKPNGFQQV